MLNDKSMSPGAPDPQFESLMPAIKVGRRGFLASSASIAGFALAAGHAFCIDFPPRLDQRKHAFHLVNTRANARVAIGIDRNTGDGFV